MDGEGLGWFAWAGHVSDIVRYIAGLDDDNKYIPIKEKEALVLSNFKK